MLKQVEHLFHITERLEAIKDILRNGFKPSYAIETLAGRKIKVLMVSFSNVLLRDVGDEEVINYGGYAIGLTREWGIRNKINPVVYTFDEGLLNSAVNGLIESSTFLSTLYDIKHKLKEFSDCKCGPASKRIELTNTSKEAMDIFDHLSMKYDEDLVRAISAHNMNIHETNLTIVSLTKPYKVTGKKGQEFIAYNDREWRKLYPDPILFEGFDGFNKYTSENKPHFTVDPYLLRFDIQDVSAIMVEKKQDIAVVKDELDAIHGKKLIKDLISEKKLVIGRKKRLQKKGL